VARPSSGTRGTVALAEARARWTAKLGRVSDHEGQFGERVGEAGGRRHVGPEIVEASTEVLDKACPVTMTLAVRSRFSPRMGRSQAFRRPWSVSMRLFAFTSVSWKAAGSSSSRTRG
jgi:hypothetical protein